ncbi:RIP metalloprotease RseP [Verticiella sediminum]|uniref:Zinc metalloprotease n=1 Tax=Verticiella sediminum TaxID=1247510 RepID=A0A556ABT1_9BURK|nr:RIP metalloprotease RseP [Verticiella sediminum]TSH90327.1 RIP metalloprotease RseP [Verticiella sediminum]
MLLTLIAFAVALGVLIVIHEYGHFWVARRCGVRVLRFSVGFGKVLLRRTDRHGTEWAVSAVPLGGYVKMLDSREGQVPAAQRHEAFDTKSVWQRIAIVSAGPLANLLLASLLYAVLYMVGVREPEPGQAPPLPVIQAVQPDGAAAAAGVQVGDRVLAIDGMEMPMPDQFVSIVGRRAEQPVVLRVEREGQPLQLTLVPRAQAQDDGSTVGRIGVQLGVDTRFVEVRYGPLESLARGVERTGEVAWFSLRMLGRMVTGEASWRNLSGPVTIADYAGQTARLGLIAYISFIALVSVSLGVLNLLPIPMLDGGHLLYYLVEIVRGSPPPERWLELGQRAGLGILVALMSVALFNDFARLLG